MSRPTVSIVIPTLGRHSLIETIESIRRQDYPPGLLEVTAIADGPKAYEDLMHLFIMEPINIIRLGRNARSIFPESVCEVPQLVGFYAAGGDYIFQVADDDALAPGLISAYVERMQRDNLQLLLGPGLTVDLERIDPHFVHGVPLCCDHAWDQHGPEDRRCQMAFCPCQKLVEPPPCITSVTGFMFTPECLRAGNFNPLYGIGAENDLPSRWHQAGIRTAIDLTLPSYLHPTGARTSVALQHSRGPLTALDRMAMLVMDKVADQHGDG